MMTTRSRIHPSLVVAVALSMAGCTPARFDANPAQPAVSTQQAGNTTTPPTANGGNSGNVTPPANGNGQTPATTPPTTTPAAPTLSLMDGTAQVLAGEPIANGKITVTSAITGKSYGIIAAGAGNIIASGGGNIIAAGGANEHLLADTPPSTDKDGNFSFNVQNLDPNDVVKVEVSDGTKSLSILVDAAGTAIGGTSGYVLEALKFHFTMDAATTATAAIYAPLFATLVAVEGTSGPLTAIEAKDVLRDSARETSRELSAQLRADPSQANEIATAKEENRIAYSKEHVALSRIELAVERIARSNPKIAAALSDEAGSPDLIVEIHLTSDGKLQIGDAPPIDLDQNVGEIATEVFNDGAQIVAGTCVAAGSDATSTYSNAATFKPVVTVNNDAGSLTIKVTQAAGELDIQTIEASLATADVTFAPQDSTSAIGSLTVSDPAHPTVTSLSLLPSSGSETATDWHGTFQGGGVTVGNAHVTVDKATNGLTKLTINQAIVGATNSGNTTAGHTTTFTSAAKVFAAIGCSSAVTIKITSAGGTATGDFVRYLTNPTK